MREALSRGTDCVYVQLSQYILTDEGRDEPYFLLLSLAPSCSNSGWRCTDPMPPAVRKTLARVSSAPAEYYGGSFNMTVLYGVLGSIVGPMKRAYGIPPYCAEGPHTLTTRVGIRQCMSPDDTEGSCGHFLEQNIRCIVPIPELPAQLRESSTGLGMKQKYSNSSRMRSMSSSSPFGRGGSVPPLRR